MALEASLARNRAASATSSVLISLLRAVLAAHEPVAVLNLGIVAKIDLAEVRTPFETAGIIVVGIAVVVIVVGTILFFHVGDSIIRQAQKSEERFRKLFEGALCGHVPFS